MAYRSNVEVDSLQQSSLRCKIILINRLFELKNDRKALDLCFFDALDMPFSLSEFLQVVNCYLLLRIMAPAVPKKVIFEAPVDVEFSPVGAAAADWDGFETAVVHRPTKWGDG